ncbi:HAPLESS 2 protein [Nymphaea thermarum]|nr:HAPLESS 2 protein [Nymphaea thermarum]
MWKIDNLLGQTGREASIMAELVETENTSNGKVQTIKESPVITIKKSAVYAVYEISYIRVYGIKSLYKFQDVAYRPEELYVHTRKCEPEAGPNVVGGCSRQLLQLLKEKQILPIVSDFKEIGMEFSLMFHIFGVGKWSLDFSIHVEVKTQSRKSEVVLGPEKKMMVSSDNLLRANLVGDYVGYTSIPSFENFYLVTPREGNSVQLDTLGGNYSMWMLLERVRFTLDGTECNKIGVSYEAFNRQPDFCRSPFWSCLHNQLWNFWESDSSRIKRGQPPQFMVEKRFERINQHPVNHSIDHSMFVSNYFIRLGQCLILLLIAFEQSAGSHTFSIGITEVLSTNLLIELNADDVHYVVHRSPGDILNISIPTFEALAQFGTATIISKNTGTLEASYSLVVSSSIPVGATLLCLKAVGRGIQAEGCTVAIADTNAAQDPGGRGNGGAFRPFLGAILKDCDFKEVDRAECQFTTIGTIIDTGTQVCLKAPHGFSSCFLWS